VPQIGENAPKENRGLRRLQGHGGGKGAVRIEARYPLTKEKAADRQGGWNGGLETVKVDKKKALSKGWDERNS